MKYIKYYFIINIICLTTICKSQVIVGAGYSINIDNGIYFNIGGNWENNGTFNSDNLSFVKMLGGQQVISGTNTTRFGNLIIDGTGNKILGNLASQTSEITNALIFNTQKIEIHNNNLVLLPASVIVNADNQKFVITNGTGSLIKKALPTGNDFLFPVGDAANSYKPVILNYVTTIDTFAVRVIDDIFPANQTSVQKTYIIKSSHPLTSIADITLGWNIIDEGSSFISAQSLMWQQQTGVWTLLPDPIGAISNVPSTDWKYKSVSVQFLSSVADSFIVKSSAPPIIIDQPQSIAICENDSVSFSVTASGYGMLTFQWQVNCSGVWSNIADGGTSPQYIGANDSTLLLNNVPYSSNGCSYQCIVSNVSGSILSNPALLTVFPLPFAFIIGDSAICQGEIAQLTAQGSGTSYLWNTNETTQSIAVFPLPPSQTYAVTVTDNNSCTNTAEITVQTTADFLVSLTSNFEPDNTIIAGQNITFTALPPAYYNYIFIIGSDTVQSSASNILSTSSVADGDLITVIAFVNDCSASDSLIIGVKPVPNAFTPYDLNGKNDLYAKGIDLVIINRWGQVLYQGIEGWDGTYNGKLVSPGTYFYNMIFNKNTKESFTVRGSVLVVSDNN